MGKVDQTLFLLMQGRDILIVQVYVDDIVFGGSSNSLVARFAEDMSKEFEMSMMGELQFFLGLQIKQSKEGTFVHQAFVQGELHWSRGSLHVCRGELFVVFKLWFGGLCSLFEHSFVSDVSSHCPCLRGPRLAFFK
jgi:hypothetical protein